MAGEKLPKKLDDSGPDDNENETRILNVDQFHYHGNDLKELRKLSETNPELAKQVLDSTDEQNRRHHISERFGLCASVGLVVAAMCFVVAIIWTTGIWTTLLAIGLIFAVALLIRVILTGKWSDTTWFGKLVNAIAKALGSEGKNDRE